jgi:hypothetical protein
MAELLRLLLRGALEVDPGQPVAVKLSEAGPGRDVDMRRLPDTACADARQAGHRY